jgi:hypothetical protein
MPNATKKRFENADEVRTPPNVRVEVVDLGGATAMRGTFEPGWKWSESMKPIVGTDTCQTSHLGYVVSGTMVVKMDDGNEITFNAGDAAHIPPGHDAWVTGTEPCVFLDFQGGANYALPSKADAAG